MAMSPCVTSGTFYLHPQYHFYFETMVSKHTVKPVYNSHPKIDKTNGSLMKVDSIAECSL